MGNMSTLEDVMSEPMKEMCVKQEESEIVVKPGRKGKKRSQQGYRQKLQAVQARIKYREKTIKGFKQHLEKGTFPKRFKSLRPYPKMYTPESQAIVNAACQQVECVILDRMVVEEELKLTEDQSSYQALKQERKVELSPVPRKPKMLTVLQLQQELKDLQSKYTELCSKLDGTQ